MLSALQIEDYAEMADEPRAPESFNTYLDYQADLTSEQAYVARQAHPTLEPHPASFACGYHGINELCATDGCICFHMFSSPYCDFHWLTTE